jgi:hypothetical protein
VKNVTFTKIADGIAARNIDAYYNQHSYVMTEDGYEVSDANFPDPDFDYYYSAARHEAYSVLRTEINEMAQNAIDEITEKHGLRFI